MILFDVLGVCTEPLLLANPSFLPYLLDGLMLEPSHPRAGLPEVMKTWVQDTHSECFAQLAVHPEGCDALLAEPTVGEQLRRLVREGWSEQARESGRAALLAMSDRAGERVASEVEQLHVMISVRQT